LYMSFRFKRHLSLLLALLSAAALVLPSAYAAYIPKNDPKSNYASNIVLIYTGYYNPDNYQGERIGDYTKDRFLPYVGYLDAKGKAQDYFFDTFLLLTTASPHHGSLTRWYSWVPNSVPGRLVDWQWAMDRPFEKNLQLDALDRAVAEVSRTLGDKDKKVNVYLTLPFPDPQSRDFGDFNGDGISEDLQSLDVRNELVKWYVDEMIARFQKKDYKHLTLAGFYWLQEDLDTTVPGEAENVRYAASYLNSLGMRLGWIPWSGAGEKMRGNQYGFDFTLVQPNHYFQADTTIQQIEDTALQSQRAGEGVEIEFDQRAIEDPVYRQKLLNYLIGGVKYEYMKDSLLAYYQDVYGVYDLYHHSSPAVRALYDDLYRFAKGTYTAPVGNFEGHVRDANGQPIAGAVITGSDGFQAITGSDGSFTATGLLATQHPFTISKEGYVSRTINVEIAANQTLRQDVLLRQMPGGEVKDQYVVEDFEGDFDVGGNSVVSRSFTTQAPVGFAGSQALKVYYPPGWGPVRAFIDSGSEKLDGSDRAYVNYKNTDWSNYDTLSMQVYNSTNVAQTLILEFMYDSYSWETSRIKSVTLEPQQWNRVKIPIQELKDLEANVRNIIRLSLTMNDPFPTYGATLYFDDIRLLKYEDRQLPPDYAMKLPSSVPVMNLGSSWTPFVHNKSENDDAGQPSIVREATFESSDSNVLTVSPDGKTVTAKAPGQAVLTAKVGDVWAGSAVIQVSSAITHQWNDKKLVLKPGTETTLTLKSSFDNGYLIPWKDAVYQWKLQGDSVQMTDQTDGNSVIANQKRITAVKAGKSVVTVTITYNGHTETFERTIQVSNVNSLDDSDE